MKFPSYGGAAAFAFALSMFMIAPASHADVVVDFTAGEGWIAGNVDAAGQPTPNIFVSDQANAYTVDPSGTGTVSVGSESFLRSFIAEDGAAMDIDSNGGMMLLDFSNLGITGFDNGGNPLAANQRLFVIDLVANPADVNNPTSGVDAAAGIQVVSTAAGTYAINPSGFNQNGGAFQNDTGITIGNLFDIQLKYTEDAAGDLSLDVFVNGSGTSIYSDSGITGLGGNDLYVRTNTSQGTQASGANGIVEFDGIGIAFTQGVPEPGTLALFGLASLGLAFRRRR